MFLNVTMDRNPSLIETAVYLHKSGQIEPDTYVVDLDTLLCNAKKIKDEGDKYGIKLYFMTKQIGRNPYVAKKLMNLGYDGAVAVDYKEAQILGESGIKLGHVGHIVQIPNNSIERILKLRPEYITVYSIEKAQKIGEIALRLGMQQKIMLRIIDNDDILYPGQYGGFYLDNLSDNALKIKNIRGVEIKGITSFPCFLYDENTMEVKPTQNVYTLKKAKLILENLGITIEQMNEPSATCVDTIKSIKENGGTHGEPGHGLLGTTPLHAAKKCSEIPAMVYVSEISHNLNGKSYCFGGGHYRRSHMKGALVVGNKERKLLRVETPNNESIDYYFELDGNAEVGDTVIMSYRTQIFVTRSNVAIVEGIRRSNPKIVGIYDSQGKQIRG